VSDIVKRLRASVAFNAVDGDAMERSVCKRQMTEAADDIEARDSRIRELEKLLADRDAAWERAIQSLAEQGVITIDDPIAAVRERMEAEGGRT
jgi:hypothetical protein